MCRYGSLININPSEQHQPLEDIKKKKGKNNQNKKKLRTEKDKKEMMARKKETWQVVNDPLGQTHSLASSEHCFGGLKLVLCC